MGENKQTAGKLGVIGLACIVISSMVGGGVFSLPQNMAAGASAGAVLIAWLVTGIGMYFIANTFSILSRVKPDLTSGVYMYAREGFGRYVGFTIGWGYWLCQIFGNVGFAVITMDALNYFFPPYFAGGNNLLSIVCGSVLIWVFNFVVLRGVRQAAILNVIGTVGKLVPILLFCLIMLFVFHLDKFDFNFWGHIAEDGKTLGSLGAQLKSTMLVTLWAFIGIEGAVVLFGPVAEVLPAAQHPQHHPLRLREQHRHRDSGVAECRDGSAAADGCGAAERLPGTPDPRCGKGDGFFLASAGGSLLSEFSGGVAAGAVPAAGRSA